MRLLRHVFLFLRRHQDCLHLTAARSPQERVKLPHVLAESPSRNGNAVTCSALTVSVCPAGRRPGVWRRAAKVTRRSLDEPQTHLSPQSATAQTADHGRRRSARRASAWSRSSCHSRRAAGGLVLEPVRAAGNRQTATHSARRGSRSALRGRAGCATSRRSSLFPLGDSRRSRSPRAGSRCARPCRPRRVASVHGLRPFR